MPLSNASRLADFGTGIGTAGAIIQVDNANQRLGVGTTAPTATLGVAGIVSATAFYGDGSNLDGVASAGLGTALSEEEFNPLTVIYQTSDTLSVGATITVDPPDATTKVAYTQYAEVKLEGDADLIVADGDDFIPDILGLSTEGFSFSNANGNGVFDTVYTDNIENAAGRGGPNFPLGITVSGISTLSGNVSIGGTLTYEDVTNVDSIGIVTARSGIDITGGNLNVPSGNLVIGNAGTDGVLRIRGAANSTQVSISDNTSATLRIKTASGALGQILVDSGQSLVLGSNNTERLRIGPSGQLGLSGANYGTSGQVMTSQGASAAPQWADAGGGAWEVVQSTALSGSNTYLDFNGWSNSYQKYQLVFSDIYWTSEFRIYCRFYKDATSGNAGTLQTASQYKFGAISNTIQNSGNIQSNGNSGDYYQIGKGDYGYLWNGYFDFPMRTWTADATYTGSTCIGLTMRDNEVFPGDACFYDTNKGEFLTGIRLYFFNDAGNAAVSPTQGRFTILRMKYS